MERLICLVMGYVFGLFQTGYLYSRSKHMDIRNYGSGNSGSTNVLRVMGKKAGLVVFLGDAGKMILACLLTRVIFRSQPESLYLYLLYTGFGVILGHNFPFYMGFKGGKGIAATAGLLVAMDLRVTAVCLIAFILIVAVTRYVSLGSLVVVTLFLIGMVFFGSHGAYGLGNQYLTEFYLVSAAVTLMAFWRHRSNIGRLIHGTENKIGSKKK